MTTDEIIYHEAIRRVEQQERSLGELRWRAWIMFALLALTTSFLGVHAVSGSAGLGGWGWVGLIAALSSAIFTLTVLLPGDPSMFAADPLKLLPDNDANSLEPDHVHRALAELRGAHVKDRDVQLRFLAGNLRYGVLAFVVSVAALLAQVGTD